ncbi:AI-2E family transporter [Nocardioides sp. BP30]|uniref:AI-2E family transporter n=1 Tax=Nocardioides sp. BP30 TaxID=3036374 RepID=UPI002468AD7D|nr:AI-2E family transporter [Nocardioides sp. BP30]WGL50386.1 AI-2E family transporter [Nocardioides sp. BP30]
MTERLVPGVPRTPRVLVVLLEVAAAVVVIAGARVASALIGPIFLALVVTIAAHPLRARLDRHLPRWVSSLISLLVVNLVIVGLGCVLIVAVARFASLLPQYEATFDEHLDQLTAHLRTLSVSQDQIQHLRDHLDLGRLTDVVTSALSGIFGALSGLLFILALVLFMTIDGSGFPARLAEAAEARPALVEAVVGFARGTRRYLLVSTVFGLIVAVCDTVALAIMGVPAPMLWGLLAFLTNYIPNIGFLIGLVPPAVLAGLDSGLGLLIAVVVVYSLLNLVIQSAIQPKVVGDAVGLSTTLTFLSLVFWSWVIGPLGAILAIPLSLFVKALLIDADPASHWLRPLVSNRAPAAP